MCDRVTILRQGEVVVSGEIRTLLHGDVLSTDVLLAGVTPALDEKLVAEGFSTKERPGLTAISVQGEARVRALLALALAHDAQVVEVAPRKETMEDLFMKKALARRSEEES